MILKFIYLMMILFTSFDIKNTDSIIVIITAVGANPGIGYVYSRANVLSEIQLCK